MRTIARIVHLLMTVAFAETSAHQPWLHPAGIVSRATVAQMRAKCERYPWAAQARDQLVASVRPWLEVSMDRIRQLTPSRQARVYHNFSCPRDHARLEFSPFKDRDFRCPVCGTVYAPDVDAGVYPPDSPYAGDLYSGWACLYFLSIADATYHLGMLYALTGESRYAQRALEILTLFAERTPNMPRESVGGRPVIFTYHTEGEIILLEFLLGYELSRQAPEATPELRQQIEESFLRPFCEDVFVQEEYRIDWNNVYHWQLVLLQAGATLEDRRLIDFAIGLGQYSPEARPQHRSLRYLARHHFRPDGAYYELCSGYHLYAVTPFLRALVAAHNLSVQEPERFPPADYDLLAEDNPVGDTAGRAVRWYLALALPDLTMSQLGDSMSWRDSMAMYDPCAEIAYRYLGAREVAWYPEMQRRGLSGLIYGADEIVPERPQYRSTYLSSGYVALRRVVNGDCVYAGINALEPGGGHQHADRLCLTTYALDRLLGCEKANPYNNLSVQEAGRRSDAHNTVVVDRTSQPPGCQLSADQIPSVRYFQSTPVAEFAEVWADRIYPQTRRYRRAVALCDNVVVDIFDVAGGDLHDWIYHADGQELTFSPALEPRDSFDTPTYLVGGQSGCETAVLHGTWQATWTLPPESKGGETTIRVGAPEYRVDADAEAFPGRRATVHHRLTMLGSPGTEVYHLRTYPIQKVPSLSTGFTHTVLARRASRASNAPFVALLEAYDERPRVVAARGLTSEPNGTAALLLETLRARWLVLYNPVPEALLTVTDSSWSATLTGHYAVVRYGVDGRPDGVLLCGAQSLEVPGLQVQMPRTGNLAATAQGDGQWRATVAAEVAYQTVNGEDLWHECEEMVLRLHSGNGWVHIKAPGPPPRPGALPYTLHPRSRP